MAAFGTEIKKATGFASPALGYEAKTFDFNEILLKNPPATFIMRQDSPDMEELGIFKGSLLVVDRSIKPRPGSFVVFSYENDFLCRQMARQEKSQTVFTNGEREMRLNSDEYLVFGTVRSVIREVL